MKSKCKCNPLWKLIATNFPYFWCPKCGKEYFSYGDAEVIDKCDLGTLAKRERELVEKAKELGLPSPFINEEKLEKIRKIVKEEEEED